MFAAAAFCSDNSPCTAHDVPPRYREEMRSFIKKISLIPLLGLSSCLYLMTGMSMENWFWFGIWSAVGVCIYFAYGYRHSNLHDKQKTH